MFDKLGILESCLSDLQMSNKLLNMVENFYTFNRNISIDNSYVLEEKYKDIQTLLYFVIDNTNKVEKRLKSACYGLYEDYERLGVKENEKKLINYFYDEEDKETNLEKILKAIILGLILAIII